MCAVSCIVVLLVCCDDDSNSLTCVDDHPADLKPGSVQLHRADGEDTEAGEAVGGGDDKAFRRAGDSS